MAINNFVGDFCSELTRLKTDIVLNLSTETRFNTLIALCAINIAIGAAVRGFKSRPIQTSVLSFGGIGFILVPEMYFGLIKKKSKQQVIQHYFIDRNNEE